MRLNIAQQYGRQVDIPCEIHLGEWLPDPEPTVYYKDFGVERLFVLFHREDYSELPAPIRWMDEHPFDLEGAIIGPDGSLSIFHHKVKEIRSRARTIWVEKGGHGIQFAPLSGNFLWLTDYRLIEITDSLVETWRADYQPVLNR